MSATKLCPQCGGEYDDEQRFCPRDGSTLRPRDPAADLAGQVVADRYHVLRKLGEGGMGQVWLAEHVKMGRKSALKVMHPSMGTDADAISRFVREATNASRVSHPNVCAIYDFGETPEGLIWLAMEYVEGEPLTALIGRAGALPAARAAEIARQTAEALAAAHDLGIVHRDLKPDNVMVARGRDGADLVKVVDFGIAKAASGDAQRVTRTGLVVGTPQYMSPEQLAGDPVDARSDVYALALVTFTMLTGTLPFPSATVQEAMLMRLTDRPRTLAELRPGVRWPPALQRALDRALARESAARPSSATEFAGELLAAVAEMPEATIAAAGTEIVAAATLSSPSPASPLPATRIAAAERPSTPAGAAARAARPARRARRTALVAALALLAAASLGGALRAWRGAAADDATGARPADTGSGGPSLAVAIPRDSAAGDPAGRRARDVARPDTSARETTPAGAPTGPGRAGAAPAPPGAGAGAARGGAAGAGAAEASRALEGMKRVIDAALEGATGSGPDAEMRAALERIAREADALLPRIASDTDIAGADAEALGVDARFFRAVALGLLGEPGDETCALLGRIQGRAGRLTSAGEITQLYGSFCRSA